jgi:serine protease Do
VNSVVHIHTQSTVTFSRDPYYEYFFGPAPRQQGIQQSSGSGVIIDSDGYVVTNNHVVQGADKITVTLNNNKTYTAKVIGTDPGTDIALLKVDGSNLPAISFGNSDEVKLGEWVLAVGNPFNLTSTVTAGIVSAKSRNIHILESNPDANVFPIESFIQTDAAVNPGNSGGALVNSKGELIGINTAIASQTGSYSGYSFAVPVNLVQKVTSDLRKFGVVQRAFLGVNIRDIDHELAEKIGLSDVKGVYVGGLVAEGAAEKGGIKEGDVIISVGNVNINTVPQLQEQVGRYRPGDEVNIRIMRDKKEMIVPVKLRNSEGTTAIVKKEDIEIKTVHGAAFGKVSVEEKNLLKLKGGAKVITLSSGKIASAGIKKGFIITRIDQQEITNPEQVYKILEGKKGSVIVEGYYPNGSKGYFSFGL